MNLGFSHVQQEDWRNILRYEVTKTRSDGMLDKRFKNSDVGILIRRIIRCMNKEQWYKMELYIIRCKEN
jgi:hypothetical protein